MQQQNFIPDPEPSDPYDPSFPLATEVHENVQVLTDLNALEFARLMRSLGTGSLWITHTTKNGQGNDEITATIKSSDFFNAETNPTMTFRSTSISGDGESYTLVGDLTLNGITQPVELDVEFFGTSVFPMDQSTRAGFAATGSISRKDFEEAVELREEERQR